MWFFSTLTKEKKNKRKTAVGFSSQKCKKFEQENAFCRMSFNVKYLKAAVVEFVSYSLSELRFRELFSLATNVCHD